MKPSSLRALGAGLILAAPAAAQSNLIPGTDVALGALSSLTQVGRTGVFPGGTNALSMATTSCNKGTVNVPWLSPMQENHPLIAFLVTRLDDSGRLVQISNYSHVKHGFFALADSQCDPCTVNPFGHDGTFLGVGCSDTYSVSNNSNNFFLAPAAEIDPWLGTWEATCSFFDAGTNPQPGTMCDGVRSFTSGQAGSLGPLGNRVIVPDAALSSAGNPTFAYSSYYVIRAEPEANRNNNLGSRSFQPTWNGSSWNFTNTGALLEGSVLQRWTGATVTSAKNGSDDGRVFLASKVTGPHGNGLYRYEYALHNRDNFRGVGELRLPVCESAVLSGFGFRDLDVDFANNWTFTRIGGELVIDTSNNPLAWNSIYNFWFDSSAAPTAGNAILGQFFTGAGADAFAVAATVPGTEFDVALGAGCSAGTVPSLTANGQATLGNAGFALLSSGHAPATPVLLFTSASIGATDLGNGCVLHLGGLLGVDVIQAAAANANGAGLATLSLPVPAVPALEGVDLAFQGFAVSLGGPFLGLGNLTDARLVRLGNLTAGCSGL
jgi:hypothetical protein